MECDFDLVRCDAVLASRSVNSGEKRGESEGVVGGVGGWETDF